jgi:hypothetical protein
MKFAKKIYVSVSIFAIFFTFQFQRMSEKNSRSCESTFLPLLVSQLFPRQTFIHLFFHCQANKIYFFTIAYFAGDEFRQRAAARQKKICRRRSIPKPRLKITFFVKEEEKWGVQYEYGEKWARGGGGGGFQSKTLRRADFFHVRMTRPNDTPHRVTRCFSGKNGPTGFKLPKIWPNTNRCDK